MKNISINDISSLITTIATRKESINWIELLPISDILSNQPENFMQAFNQVNVGVAIDFIDCVATQAADIIGEVILWKISENNYLLEDDNIKIHLQENRIEANERIEKRLSFIKEKIVVMNETKDNMVNRLSGAINLVEEEVRISTKLESLRRDELFMDNPNLERLHEMENEIIRLESTKRILDSYNFKDRNLYKENLKREIESLGENKKVVENEIKELNGNRDILQNEVKNLTTNKEYIEKELNNLQTEKANLISRVKIIRDSIEEISLDKEALKIQVIQAEKEENENKKLIEKIRNTLKSFTILRKEIDGTPIEEAFKNHLEGIINLIKNSPVDEIDKNFKR